MSHLEPLEGRSVLVTGNLPTLSRSLANDMITALGGRHVASVSGSTGLVILGDGAGLSKMLKVRTHDLQVMSGEEFELLVQGTGEWTDPPGTKCSIWEIGRFEEDEPEDVPDPRDAVPMSERHLLGIGTGLGPLRPGSRIRDVEYRSLCIKCGDLRTGPDRASVSGRCVNDPLLPAVHEQPAAAAESAAVA